MDYCRHRERVISLDAGSCTPGLLVLLLLLGESGLLLASLFPGGQSGQAFL